MQGTRNSAAVACHAIFQLFLTGARTSRTSSRLPLFIVISCVSQPSSSEKPMASICRKRTILDRGVQAGGALLDQKYLFESFGSCGPSGLGWVARVIRGHRIDRFSGRALPNDLISTGISS